jgi:hypothetical protein
MRIYHKLPTLETKQPCIVKIHIAINHLVPQKDAKEQQVALL